MEQNGQAIMGGFGGSGGVYSAATTGPVARLMAAAWGQDVRHGGIILSPPKMDDFWSQPSILVGTVVIFWTPVWLDGDDEHIEYGNPVLNHQGFLLLLPSGKLT